MPGYSTRQLTVLLGGHDYLIRALSDRQQFADPHGEAERLGISPALWGLFGQLWPAGALLAEAMAIHEVAGKRVLELGCGLALSSLVLQRRKADITASDHHPLAELFLRRNARQNHLPLVAYRDLPWAIPDASLGRFDLIIGSDILYERGHAELLAALVLRHAGEHAEILITDPGRGNSARFSKALALQGFAVDEILSRLNAADIPPFRGRLLSYRRTHAMSAPSASNI
jgi:predicted nicotinamide N-methyase